MQKYSIAQKNNKPIIVLETQKFLIIKYWIIRVSRYCREKKQEEEKYWHVRRDIK